MNSYNLVHNWLRLFFPLYKIRIFFMINSMLNHVALLNPPLPQLNVELLSWYITKSCFSVAYNIELRGGEGGDKVCFVNVH